MCLFLLRTRSKKNRNLSKHMTKHVVNIIFIMKHYILGMWQQMLNFRPVLSTHSANLFPNICTIDHTGLSTIALNGSEVQRTSSWNKQLESLKRCSKYEYIINYVDKS